MFLEQRHIVEDSQRLKYDKHKGTLTILAITEIIKMKDRKHLVFLAGLKLLTSKKIKIFFDFLK